MTETPSLRPLAPEDRDVFAAMVPTYLAEIAPLVPAPGQQQITEWWTDPTRHAFTIHAPDLAGFALVRRLPNGTHEISEFYVTPARRSSGVGQAAVAQLFPLFPGRWQLGIAKGSPQAQAFWTRALAAHTVRRGPPLTPHQTGSLHFIVKETSP